VNFPINTVSCSSFQKRKVIFQIKSLYRHNPIVLVDLDCFDEAAIKAASTHCSVKGEEGFRRLEFCEKQQQRSGKSRLEKERFEKGALRKAALRKDLFSPHEAQLESRNLSS
jgi:hypothetical protein